VASEFEISQQTVQTGWNVGLPIAVEAIASSYLTGRPTVVDATCHIGTTLVDRAGNHHTSVDAPSHGAAEFGTATVDERAIAHIDGIRDRGTDAERAADLHRIRVFVAADTERAAILARRDLERDTNFISHEHGDTRRAFERPTAGAATADGAEFDVRTVAGADASADPESRRRYECR
jgi:hypothetical protein